MIKVSRNKPNENLLYVDDIRASRQKFSTTTIVSQPSFATNRHRFSMCSFSFGCLSAMISRNLKGISYNEINLFAVSKSLC